MRLLRQILVLTYLGLLGIPRRKWTSLVLVGSVACVIGVLVSMLSVTAGMLRAYRSGEDPRLAIVLGPDNTTEWGHGVAASAVGTILDAPGIAHRADGHPLGDPEVLIYIASTGVGPYVSGAPLVRGIGATGLALHPQVRIIAGRGFRSGRQELTVGAAAARAFGLHLGDRVSLPGGSWPIVGVFADDGSVLEGEFMGDADTLLAAGRSSGYGSVLVRLETPQAFEAFAHWIATNPDLKETAERLTHYSQRTANENAAFFTALAYTVGCLMTLGALFGTVKLMYAAVSTRTREIATLRAIGYQPLPVAASVLLETAVLAIAGALIGVGVAWLSFDGRHTNQARAVFDLSVSGQLMLLGIVWALTLALLGGVPPAFRAARRSVREAFAA
ncbi:MAG TPA: FtsX-like permease family protein [Steroidobacteraceae bacterium]|nr:FtsX-like permease family protein [Steroidobacteraceae bacterium]